MADKTKIEWADATVNAINGCSLASPGCTNCYAMRLAGTRMKHHPSRAGLTQDSKAGPVWTGEVRLNETALLQPLKWRKPRKIFWNAHGDTFHDNVPDEWIDRVFAVCAQTPQHTHMILTKRSARMREYFASYRLSRLGFLTRNGEEPSGYGGTARDDIRNPDRWPLPNVWLGVSVEDQARANERIPDLLATPAAVHFISAEPLLGPVDLNNLGVRSECNHENASVEWDTNALNCDDCEEEPLLDWVICGGESGPGARPMHPDWARSLRDQCAATGVAFHFKQWGEWVGLGVTEGRPLDGGAWPSDTKTCIRLCIDGTKGDDGFPMQRVGKAFAGRLLDGVAHDGVPA